MCGIATTLLYPQHRPNRVWQAIKENLTQNLLANEERGKTATGVLVMQADGQMALLKRALPARQFVTLPEYQTLLEQIGPKTTILLGHTRHPTKGSPAIPDNNHPLLVGPVVGVHNGHIDNDDDLFARFALPRQAQVDSEIIFRLIAQESPLQANQRYLLTLTRYLQCLQGKFTFIAADQRAPHRLLVLRSHNPLSIHWHKEWQALIFSSRYLFLRRIFGPNVRYEIIPSNNLLLFDACQLPKDGPRPIADQPLCKCSAIHE